MKPLQGIIVICVWIFIIAQFLIYMALFMPLVFKHSKVYFYILFPSIIISFILFCYCYFKTTFTDPGSPSYDINSYYPNLEQIKQKAKQQEDIKHAIRSGKHPNLLTQFDQIQSMTHTSYCLKCNLVKQPRTHHCKACGKCILRMDHHCPWVGNCVGKYNHKYFMLFLLYATICVLLVSITLLVDYMKEKPWSYQLSQNRTMILYYAIFSAGALGLGVFFLLGAQIYFLINNMTTIQSYVPGMSIQQPFAKTTFSQNMSQIMGDSVWFLPSPPFRLQNPHHSYVQV